jgi:hypothetical protein
MTIQELLDLARNKLATLARQREHAWSQGDSALVAALDAKIATTEDTIEALEGLAQCSSRCSHRREARRRAAHRRSSR